MTRLLHFPYRTLEELQADERRLVSALEEVRAEIARAEAPGGVQKPREAKAGHSPSPTSKRAAAPWRKTTGGEP